MRITMSDETNNGVDQTTDSQKSGKYASIYASTEAMDKELGGSESRPAEEVRTDAVVKPEAKAEAVKSTSTEQQPGESHKGFLKRIDILTSRNKKLEERLANLEKSSETKKVEPKLTKDNFINEAEYQEYLIDQKVQERLDKMSAKQSESQAKQSEEAERSREFQSSWAKRVQTTLTPIEAQELADLTQDESIDLHDDIHEVISYSDLGPKILRELLLRPEAIKTLNAMPSSIRGAKLMQLESYLRESGKKDTTKKVSTAPDPIGMVGVGASTNTGELTEAQKVEQYRKNKSRGR
jgi:hypothetical protein